MAKKILFIDRDGTIIVEPPHDFQIDSLEDLEFLAGSIGGLAAIAAAGEYELVLVSNQDGLGTDSLPEENFWPAHHKMLRILAGEGVIFAGQHIDRSFEHENLPTRKPGTAMLYEYQNNEEYDLSNSYVIGDRFTDVLLAQNLGCKAILLDIGSHTLTTPPGEGQNTNSRTFHNAPLPAHTIVCHTWQHIQNRLALPDRTAAIQRKTLETDIKIGLNLDGQGLANISTGLGFFDHMLHQLARHGGIDLDIQVKGDLDIDEHHTIEDTAIALGEAFLMALADKKGIMRYGFLLPMDDCLAQVAVDFSGRAWLVWDANFNREKVGDMPTEMFYHFFKSFSDAARANLNIQAQGQNEHHKIESIFKAFAKAIQMAIARNPKRVHLLPSTKGVL